MESYKLVNSIEVRRKSNRLFDDEISESKEVQEMTFIFIDSDGFTNFTNGKECFLKSPYKEITQADFLALPEPLKVGDWCFSTFELGKDIGCIPLVRYKEGMGGIGLSKLTPEQIKVLGLED